MDRETFNVGFALLLAGFPMAQKTGSETEEVYWSMLRNLPGDVFEKGIKASIANCKYFPTVHEIIDNAAGEQWTEGYYEDVYNQRSYHPPRRIPSEEILQKIMAEAERVFLSPPTRSITVIKDNTEREEPNQSELLKAYNDLQARYQQAIGVIAQQRLEIERLKDQPRMSVEQRRQMLREQWEFLKKRDQKDT